MFKRDIEAIKSWTDRTVKTSRRINFVKIRNNMYDFETSGKGHNNRCTWCASFRTALKTHFGNLVEQTGDCPLNPRESTTQV